mgnify:CR=1 FL=1
MSVSINAVKVEDEAESKRLIRLALLSDALPFSFIDTAQNIERFYIILTLDLRFSTKILSYFAMLTEKMSE